MAQSKCLFNLRLRPDKIVWFCLSPSRRKKNTPIVCSVKTVFFYLLSQKAIFSSFMKLFVPAIQAINCHLTFVTYKDDEELKQTNFLSLNSETTKRYFSWIFFFQDIGGVFACLCEFLQTKYRTTGKYIVCQCK